MKRLKAVIFLSLFLLGASFVSAQDATRANLWQKEIDAFADTDRRQTPPKDAVLFVGSSTFRKWENLRRDLPSVNVINRGFGGSELEDVNHYFDQTVTPYQPRIIFLYAGDNDISAGKTPERVLADFKTFMALVQEKSPRSKVYFVSIKPSPLRWQLRDQLQQANSLIRAECEKNGKAKFIDVWAAMLNEKGEPKPEIFLADNLHMNQKGYDIWREILKKYLK